MCYSWWSTIESDIIHIRLDMIESSRLCLFRGGLTVHAFGSTVFFVPLGFVPVALERLGELLGRATDDLVAWVVVIVCTQCTTKKMKYG